MSEEHNTYHVFDAKNFGTGLTVQIYGTVHNGFSHSQNRPELLNIDIHIRSYICTNWNLVELTENVDLNPTYQQNHETIVGAIINSAGKAITRVYSNNICLDGLKQCNELYAQYLDSDDGEIVNEVQLQKSSRQAWSLLKEIGGAQRGRSKYIIYNYSSTRPNTYY